MVLTAAKSRSSDIQKDRDPVTGDSHMKRCMDNYPEVEIDTILWKASSSTISSNMPRLSSWSWSALPRPAKSSSSWAPLARWPCVTAISPCPSSVLNGPAADTSDAGASDPLWQFAFIKFHECPRSRDRWRGVRQWKVAMQVAMRALRQEPAQPCIARPPIGRRHGLAGRPA
jgi:hypothetical protein